MLRLFPHILGNRDHHGNDDDDYEDDENEDDGDDDNEDDEDEVDGDDDAHQGGGGGGPGAAPLQRHSTCAQKPFSEQVLENRPDQTNREEFLAKVLLKSRRTSSVANNEKNSDAHNDMEMQPGKSNSTYFTSCNQPDLTLCKYT